MSAVLDAALRYAGLGMRVIPVDPVEKYPKGITKWETIGTCDDATIRGWWTGPYRNYGVGILTGRLRDGRQIFVLDVDLHDPNESGEETLADLEAEYGPLPDTVTVHTQSGGKHLYFYSPIEIHNDAGKRLGVGLDIRGEGGCVVAPPTGTSDRRRYVEDVEFGFDREPADAPDWLVDLLTYEPKSIDGGNKTDDDDPRLPSSVFRRKNTYEDLLRDDGWTLVNQYADGTSYWRRPGKDRGSCSASLHKVAPGLLNVFSTNANVPQSGYTIFGYFAQTRYNGDWKAAARIVRDTYPSEFTDPLQPTVHAGATIPPDNVDHAGENIHPNLAPNLPETFWWTTPLLTEIRNYAHASLVSADGLLGAILTRYATIIDPTWTLDSTSPNRDAGLEMSVGGSLNYFTVLLGSTGTGKSSILKESRTLTKHLIYDDEQVALDMPIGSGPGLVEAFMGEDPDNKRGPRIQVRRGVGFVTDEGSSLSKQLGRDGETLLDVLREAWSGETIGNTLADKAKTRKLAGHNYRLTYLLGLQPTAAEFLLNDDQVKIGTPQRFLWLSTTDPTLPDDPEPATLPRLAAPPGRNPTGLHTAIQAPAELRRHLKEVRIKRTQGTPIKSTDPVLVTEDSQRGQLQMKTAALLALIHGRLQVTAEEWMLASTLVATSAAVLTWCQKEHQRERRKKDAQSQRRGAEHHVAKTRAEHADVIDRCARYGANRVHNVGPITPSAFYKAMPGKLRTAASVDDYVEYAASRKWIEVDGDQIRPGTLRPDGARA